MNLISKESVEELILGNQVTHYSERINASVVCDFERKKNIESRIAEDDDIGEKLSKLPSAFEGMTNGEVFQAIFPCDEVLVNGLQDGYVHFSMKSNLDTMDCFDLEWWNAPYKAESEDKE